VEKSDLKIAFLVGGDDRPVRQSIEAVCSLPGLRVVAILVDTGRTPLRRRVKNLYRNIRGNGWSYPILRIVGAVAAVTNRIVRSTAVSSAEVGRVLREAFPDASLSLAQLGSKHRIPIHSAGNLNGAEAAGLLRECGADLGIVLGTRILKFTTFSVPPMGCINLHKGKVPEYRGMPPGFWELYDGAASAGVTVHFVDRGLDTGNIVAASTVPIMRTDTPESLLEKLHAEGVLLLASAVSAIRDGKAVPRPQEKLSVKPRTKPNRAEVAALRRRLPHWHSRSDVSTIARNLYLLLVYYSGIYFLVRQWHRLEWSRAAIFLHHRVNDYSRDVLTVDTETFAAQLLAISRRYSFIRTDALVECIRSKRPLKPTTIAIHFDDCYRDILTHGAPILRALGIPACAFLNSGFIDTDRSFPHDVEQYPFRYEMLRSSDVKTWTDLGFEVGAHTVNHVDLGTCTAEAARFEIRQCGEELKKIAGREIDLFSFPFGRLENINGPNREIIQTAGYTALFSAHGGLIGRNTSPYDIPRSGASHECPAVYCLLQIEGLALSQVAAGFRSIWSTLSGAASGPRGPARIGTSQTTG
jgi:peptidoglycan/xylan/chitin deacetylase (PgdA/CDA1 family)